MFKPWVTAIMLSLLVLPAAGCGSSNTSTSSGTNTDAAVGQFVKQEAADIQTANQGFTVEANLVKQVVTKQIPYTKFETQYKAGESTIQQAIGRISSAKPPTGAEDYQKSFVALMNQGLQVMKDQETAIRSNGTVDPKKASQVQTELTQFVNAYQKLASHYNVKA